MVWNRIDLKNFAKDSMRKNYGACVLAAFLISLVLGLDAGTLSQLEDFEMYIPEGITVTVSWMTLLIAIFAGNVFTVGCCRFFVENREYRAPEDFEMYIPEGITVTVSWMTLLIAIFAGNVFTVGCCRFFVENREYRAPVSKVFHGFQSGHYTNAVWIMFLRDVKIVLWTFLFVIPGIVKTYEYRMVPYILADQPDISARDAFAISREMMRGQKVDAWILDVSFLGLIFWQISRIFQLEMLLPYPGK